MNQPEKNSGCQKENKDARINIRVTTKEKELLQSKDQADEMSLGKFLIAASCLKWTSEVANWDR